MEPQTGNERSTLKWALPAVGVLLTGLTIVGVYASVGNSAPSATCALHASTEAGGIRSEAWYQKLGLQDLDFFTNYGAYMPRTHCLQTPEGGIDWTWITALLVLTSGVIAAYLKIFVFWRKSFLEEQAIDRNTKLMDLAWVFLWCAVCGYAMSILMFVWPAYRLLAVFLVVLNIWSWRFAANLKAFKVSFGVKRLQRELDEARASEVLRLEKLVAERTSEAEHARRLAEEANAAKSDFLANMSHEIRTPMTSILGFADIVAESQCTEEERKAASQAIVRHGRHLITILNDILDLSKIEAGKMTAESLETPVWPLVQQVAELMKPRAQSKGLTLRLEPCLPLPRCVKTDSTRLRQILCNLAGNAIKFTEQGEVAIRVRTKSEHGSDTLVIEVQDTGIGMTDEQRSRLFTPFMQADVSTSRRFGGTGLGLAISRQLANLLGGELACRAAPERGSVFELTLPCDRTRGWAMTMDELCSIDAPQAEPARNDTALAGARVLVVDDSADNLRLFRFHLERAGMLVDTTTNGLECLDAVRRADARGAAYDLILMDMQMPVMDGLAAVRALRSEGCTVPVSALTANAMTGERERCLAAGCDHFLTKPIDRTELLAACREMLELRGRGSRQNQAA